ncbi:hypothetical protein DAPPUDRAFT_268538 [Daphnia pulex]|uniref:Uncharacterized protein n=1 Tax=Daphnia pulex TaxID=6669 RepID=E9HXZ3_DAPPU|nr:hypothetical protein DAPPUDRAFT_268538 [Daphnia pulex]|eukprot:EFX63388.1 hypothetical protein DAPPUDRAFT_268538 [Daphnia pulex]
MSLPDAHLDDHNFTIIRSNGNNRRNDDATQRRQCWPLVPQPRPFDVGQLPRQPERQFFPADWTQ